MFKLRFTLAIAIAAVVVSIAAASAGDYPPLTHVDGPIGLPDRPVVKPEGGGTLPAPDGPVVRPDRPVVSGGGTNVEVSTGPLEMAPEIFCDRDNTDHPGWLAIINTSDEVIPAGTVFHYIFMPDGYEGTFTLPVDLTPNHAWETGSIIIPPLSSGQGSCELTEV